MNNPIYDPFEIFARAFELAAIGNALKEDFCREFGVGDDTVNRWKSPNESTRRRNPIGACGAAHRIFWVRYRPAAFQIQSYLKEQEINLSMNVDPLTTPQFSARELIRDLRKAIDTVEALEDRGAAPQEYKEILSEFQSIGSEYTERAIKQNALVVATIEAPSRVHRFNGQGVRGYAKS